MKRISSQLPTLDTSYYTQLREYDMNQMTNKIGAQSRIKDLRDDPLAASRSTRFQSEIMRLDRYGKNIESVRNTLSSAESNLRAPWTSCSASASWPCRGPTGRWTRRRWATSATR